MSKVLTIRFCNGCQRIFDVCLEKEGSFYEDKVCINNIHPCSENNCRNVSLKKYGKIFRIFKDDERD